MRNSDWSSDVCSSDLYVQAARLIGMGRFTILRRHILPNVLGPVLVIATIHLAVAIITEATLSFLGVGIPPTTPSLGTLIRIGNSYMFSRSEEHTSELQSLMRISYAVSCLQKTSSIQYNHYRHTYN